MTQTRMAWLNSLPITEEERTTLKYLTDYVFITALRGPDIPTTAGKVLKALLTTRLRGIVGVYKGNQKTPTPAYLLDVRGDIEHRPLRKEDLEALLAILPNCYGGHFGERYAYAHYLCHLRDAIWNSQDERVWGGHAVTVCTELSDTIGRIYGPIPNVTPGGI